MARILDTLRGGLIVSCQRSAAVRWTGPRLLRPSPWRRWRAVPWVCGSKGLKTCARCGG